MRVVEGPIEGDPWRLGAYRIAGRLGTARRGVVYEAYDAAGRRVVLKALYGDPDRTPARVTLSGDPALRERCRREIAAARGVPRACTAAVLDAELDGPRPYVVSEYVPGPTLRRAGRVFGGDDLYRLATAVATALAAIHSTGVVHRDLNPDTVLLGPEGPRVTGFGIASALVAVPTSPRFRTWTAAYTAPEQFTGGPGDAAADVFAWGAIMLYAATGTDPFEAPSMGAVMQRVLCTDPDLGPLPGPLRSLASAALSKDPDDRPTARDLLNILLEGETAPAVPAALAVPSLPDPSDKSVLPALFARGGDVAAGLRTSYDDPGLGAIAENAYAALDPAGRELASKVFLRLVTLSADGEPALRWAPVPEEEIVEAFGQLIVRRGSEACLVHPALPYAWPRLGRWMQESRHPRTAAGIPAPPGPSPSCWPSSWCWPCSPPCSPWRASADRTRLGNGEPSMRRGEAMRDCWRDEVVLFRVKVVDIPPGGPGTGPPSPTSFGGEHGSV
ncbi:hypothetical protein FHS43_004492 [Streptosporangium becharense]|uniref:Protein kinase domain-containing protein n=1 Tax=Streptosporangium becharense TaxID=1816182 RepID=A0A7W9MIF9_9ACTN|nr:serine/threonine-protein kinase [Streptosporangium becharense]MBB2913194.1 hypothetical protein [Streptosporangium becharense]MBB5822177.1 hypothetical protein [Streptosporangium becharense]